MEAAIDLVCLPSPNPTMRAVAFDGHVYGSIQKIEPGKRTEYQVVLSAERREPA